jgi:transcriptional regulator with XRE-family HTH domain
MARHPHSPGRPTDKPFEEDRPNPIDVYVGGRMRLRRSQLGLSQGALAAKIGVSFQAVQKYESGDIRISASRLYDVARILEVPPGFFFDGYPDGLRAPTLIAAHGERALDNREALALVRSYYGIKDSAIRADLLRLISRLGKHVADET